MIALVLKTAGEAGNSNSWAVATLAFAGIVLAQLVVIALYFAGRRADDRRRWHDKRLEAYSSFTADYREMLLYLASAYGLLKKGGAIDQERVSTLYEAVGRPFFDIQLLATDPVRQAAEDVMGKVAWFDLIIAPSAQGWFDQIEQAEEAKESFDEAVRRELGIAKPERRLVVQADSVLALMGNAFQTAAEVYVEGVKRLLDAAFNRRK